MIFLGRLQTSFPFFNNGLIFGNDFRLSVVPSSKYGSISRLVPILHIIQIDSITFYFSKVRWFLDWNVFFSCLETWAPWFLFVFSNFWKADVNSIRKSVIQIIKIQQLAIASLNHASAHYRYSSEEKLLTKFN